MFVKNSQVNKIIIGMVIGVFFGIFALMFIGEQVPETPKYFIWGMLLWYSTFGIILGLSAVVIDIMKKNCSMVAPWYITTPILGGWLGLVIAMLTKPEMETIISTMSGGSLKSHFWLAADNAIAGFIVGFFINLFSVKSTDMKNSTDES